MTVGSPLHVLAPDDDVAVALRDLAPGECLEVDGAPLVVAEFVPRGHKVALRDRQVGEPVTKYGHHIGSATQRIASGDRVHSHNLAYTAPDADAGAPAGAAAGRAAPATTLPQRRTFLGIRRGDGRVATRNYLAVVSTVNCSARASRLIAQRAERDLAGTPGLDGVLAVTHDLGCGMAIGGEGMVRLRRTLRGYATHPNVAGVLVVGLGCEMNQVDALLAGLDARADVPTARIDIQTAGGTRETVRRGVAALAAMVADAAPATRVAVPVSELVLGLNCGGSDGWSGITANPALGYASDLIVAQGGRSVLAETPEIYGAEDLLLGRAVSPAVAQELRDVLAWWERYTAAAGESMDNNPSPGNKEGGITTILEKSLGAVAKGGHAPLAAVYQYAEQIDVPGLGFMDTPGYDPVSVTGLIAGGATVVCFTTGRGSALGSRPAPTLKLATNSELFARMPDDMDLNCGDIVDAGVSVEEKGLEVYHALLDLASGTPSASEELGYGEDEFVPWQLGAVM